MEDRRQHPRPETNEPAFTSGDGSSISCRIVNMSSEGAAIDVPNASYVPDRFDLMMARDRTIRRCRTVWILGNRIGVHFVALGKLFGSYDGELSAVTPSWSKPVLMDDLRFKLIRWTREYMASLLRLSLEAISAALRPDSNMSWRTASSEGVQRRFAFLMCISIQKTSGAATVTPWFGSATQVAN
jgi:hypothetical protein